MLSNFWGFVAQDSTTTAIKSDEDTLSTSTTNEDETALRLFTQFPTYGTNVSRAEMLQEEEETTDIPATSPQRTPSRMEPWDSNEQGLWKGAVVTAGTAVTPISSHLESTKIQTISLLPRRDQDSNPLDVDAAETQPNKTFNGTTSIVASTGSNRPTSATLKPTAVLSILRREKPSSTLENRQDWMPDQLCKLCHGCEAPFTVFRRRHHCRLCGQVFCSSCAANFVQVEDSTLRSCARCFEEWEQSQIGDKAMHGGSTIQLQPSPAHVDHDILPLEQTVSVSRQLQLPKIDAEELVAALQPSRSASQHLNPGVIAASHLEQLGQQLLKTDAPLLWSSLNHDKRQAWTSKLMSLATQACSTVDPDVKRNGDLLDIRPYCKLKVIPGGSLQECAYLSGVVFRKSVAHKHMAHIVELPRIMLLNGGIEFTRNNEHRIASFDTLLEQEDKYTEILVGKIIKVQPTVLLVGRSVSRKAQELLLKNKIVLCQHVKTNLMQRIARQTGATILSSLDHVGLTEAYLGKCYRFRLVTFRDNEAWGPNKKNIPILLQQDDLPNHERQAALAADQLGESVADGSLAVKSGLAKRGVANTYVMLEGCPKQLGCTVVLRGADKASLKQVKRVFRFLINVAYNLKLETSYLRERCARLPAGFEVHPKNLFSSSICVDYGSPPSGRKVRPWNGQDVQQRSISGQTTCLDHQSILITSVWMTDKTQCCPAEVKGICYYSLQDVSLGQFLRDSCFNLSLKCQNPNCKKSVLDHSLSFIHNDGLINITVEHMDNPLPPAPLDSNDKNSAIKKGKSLNESDDEGLEEDSPIATWTYCVSCNKVVTPLVYISEDTWKFSFGKFLEVFFYNRDVILSSSEHGCSCQMQTNAILYFGCGRLAARFTYERVKPYGVFVRRCLPIDESFHCNEAIRELELISVASSELFVKFDKHIEKVSREARSLFGSAANRPEHLQTVLSELNMIGSEVDHAAKTLQEKIASVSDKCRESEHETGVVNEALFRFPWYSRRYLFMLTSAWNEKLSAAGQALAAMRKLARVTDVGEGTEDLIEGMRRLQRLNEVYSQYNVTDITTVMPTLPGTDRAEVDDDDFEDSAIDFPEGVDADVMASRQRMQNAYPIARQSEKPKPKKSLGTPRPNDSFAVESLKSGRSSQEVISPPNAVNMHIKNKTVTPGGAVKSALTRFFNRGGKELDPYVVDLGIFNEGRPRLEPGVGGLVIPVVDEMPSTVIAYSLSSAEYEKEFKRFSKMEPLALDVKSSNADDTYNSGEPASVQSRNRIDSKANDPSKNPSQNFPLSPLEERKGIERRMLMRNKSHIKHTFRDFDEKGQQTCKFICTTYWATQFHSVRQAFLTSSSSSKDQGPMSSPSVQDIEKCYIQSLSSAYSWNASGGKSGASFARTADDRFVIKCISRTELQMFLDCAPAYFEYLSKAFFHGLPTVLCKIVGVYQIGYHNRVTGKRTMEQVAVMQNIFFGRKISKTFDLKGSLRGRFARHMQANRDGTQSETVHSESLHSRRRSSVDSDDDSVEETFSSDGIKDEISGLNAGLEGLSTTLLDGDFLEFTNGRPLPLSDRAKAVFHMSVLNDTLFLSIINVLDYSILVGIDEERMELVVGIIDFMRQYDILKQMERVGKSLPMVVGSEAPTIIQPPLYKARFTNAMERYFTTVPSKWTVI